MGIAITRITARTIKAIFSPLLILKFIVSLLSYIVSMCNKKYIYIIKVCCHNN